MIRVGDLRYKILSIVIGVYTIFQIFLNTSFVNQNSQLLYNFSMITFFLMVVSVLLNFDFIFNSYINIFWGICALFMTAIVFYSHGYNSILYAFWMPFMILSLGIMKTTKIDFTFRLYTFICVVVLSQFGILSNGNVFDSTTGNLRYSLGFSNPNATSQIILTLLIEMLIINRGKLTKKAILMILISVGIFIFTQSRTAIFLLIILIILAPLSKKLTSFISGSIVLKFIFSLIPMSSLLLSYYIVYKYLNNPNEFMQSLDFILSGRIHFAAYYLQHFPINAVGNELISKFNFGSIVTNNYGALDNGYLSLLIQFGYLVTTIFIAIYSIVCWKIVSSDKYSYLFPGILIMFLVGFSETVFYLGAYNITIYFFCILMVHKRELKND